MLLSHYTEKWQKDFELLKDALLTMPQKPEIVIEHIGSTSIPGLMAKPIIDMDIVYFNDNDFEKLKKGLEEYGYNHNGNQGIEGREVFQRSKKEYHDTLDTITHHLYVCISNNRELKRHLLFRDYLRNHPESRKEYETLKKNIAMQALQDKKTYALLKEEMAREMIEGILLKAELFKQPI